MQQQTQAITAKPDRKIDTDDGIQRQAQIASVAGQPSKPGTGDQRSSNRAPGRLQGSATLAIQTRQAQQLLGGRQSSISKYRVPSLLQFSRQMHQLWLLAKQKSPEAEQCMQRIDEALDHSRGKLDELQQQTAIRLQSNNGIEIEVAQSMAPLRISLRFATPYGFKGAYLIADYDRLVCALLTARHTSVIKRAAAEQWIRYGARLVRHVFTIPIDWQRQTIVQTPNQQNTDNEFQLPTKTGDTPDKAEQSNDGIDL